MEKMREAMQRNGEKKEVLRSSILMLMLEWKNFEGDLDTAAKCSIECFNELEAKEKHLNSLQESVTESSKELELVRLSLEKKEEEFGAFCEREISDLERKWEELSSARKEYDGVVKLREEKLNVLEKTAERFWGEVESEQKQLEDLRKCVEDKFAEISIKEKEFDKIRIRIREDTDVLRLREEKLNEKEKTVENRLMEISTKEECLQLMEKEMETKERGLDSARKELMVKESCLDNVKEELRVKESKLDSVERELREKEHNLDSIQNELKKKETIYESAKKQLRINEDCLSSVKKELELKEKSADAIKKKLELKEQELTSFRERLVSREEDLDSIKKEYRQRSEELDFREKRLDSVSVSMQKCDDKFQLEKEIFQKAQGLFKKRMDDIALQEKQLDVRCRELKQREKHIGDRVKLLEEKEKQLKTISSAPVNSEPIDYVDRLSSGKNEQELKDESGYAIKKKLELQDQEFKKRMEAVALKGKHAEEHIDVFELPEEGEIVTISSAPVKAEPIDCAKVDRVGAIAQLEECVESLTRQKAAATCPSDTKEALTSAISKASTCNIPHSDAFAAILVGMGGKNLQKFLNDHWEEHELLRIEVSRALKVADDVRMFVLDALEGFYPTEPHKEENVCNRNIIRKSCILLLQELMRISPVLTPLAKLEASKLASDWKAKMMAETKNHLAILGFLFLIGAFGLAYDFDKNELESLCSSVAQHEQVTEICHALGISVINGQPLSSNIDKRNKQQKGCIVQSSSDPAKIVLDALRKCYSAERQLKEGSKKRKRGKVLCMKRFSDLLEQLRGVSPEMRPHVKIEATEFAVAWRATLTLPWEVVSFFNFLATFELSSLFDSDDLLALLEIVQDMKWPINLIKILGFADKIPCFIEKLIRRREWLQALTYICEFELGDLFPPMPLLKNHVTYATEQAKQICGNGSCSREDREKAIGCELSALRAAVECIVLHNLQSKYSPDPLEARISELEREMAKFSAANLPAAGRMFRNFPGRKNHFMVACGVPASSVPSVNPFYHHHQNSRRSRRKT